MNDTPPTLTDPNNMLDLEAAARHYARASLSDNTRRAYASDWADFVYWCKRKNRKPLPATPDTIALYLTTMADHLKTSSLRRRVTAIRKAHELGKHNSPTKDETVKAVMRGILR
ncbi:MAG TPA: phage integrase N-terminal SAM-like domain-containing protein, partial [Oligoflexia bacterium]|nr:phage integrase N-terminal SAM-like domain-containing protein [Oligoflexia bacterium]